MTGPGQNPVRVAVHADPDAERWAVAVADGAAPAQHAGGTLADGRLAPGPVAFDVDGDGDWRLSGGAVALELAPAGPASADGRVELCAIQPAVASVPPASGSAPAGRGGDETPITGARSADVSPTGLASVRFVVGCFPGGRGVALLARRPEGAKGQDRDVLSVAVAGERHGLVIVDPRLSTTYASGGAPRRMGIEMWLGESEDGDLFPRRFAGEATGASAVGGGGGRVRWEAHALRCHGRGEDGVGVYVLLEPQ
jgi:hypothetical protein